MGQERAEKPLRPEIRREILIAYAQTFLPRFDRYALQTSEGSYYAVHEDITMRVLRQHLYGQVTIGAYALNTKSQAQWVCLDADDQEHWQGLFRLAHELSEEHTPSYLEPSRRGGHLWLFFPEPLSGQDARRFAKQLLAEQELTNVEVYPKQDELRTGPGSLVRLPLGVHRKVNHRFHFIDLTGQPLAPTIREQMEILAAPERVSPTFVALILALATQSQASLSLPSLERKTTRMFGENVSDRLKSRISVYNFVSQYVELDHQSRGFCPFHDDQHKSFAVNTTGNFWHCFAGCGGGSLIDFWSKWRAKNGEDPAFTETITDLAQMLL